MKAFDLFDTLLKREEGQQRFTDKWSHEPFVLKSDEHSFHDLYNWESVERLLREQRPVSSRFVVMRKGIQQPLRDYVEMSERSRQPRINIPALRRLMKEGASLVINNVEEVDSTVKRGMQSLERWLGYPVIVNAYASWGAEYGFVRHWDSQDTLIIQVEGSKRWQIQEPTMIAPLRGTSANPPDPAGPTLEITLQTGDALHVPRGWWHLVTPLGCPTLHLTVTCEAPTGYSFVQWLIENDKDSEFLRSDFPLHFDSDQAAATYRNRLVAALDELASAGSVRSFQQWSRQRTREELQELVQPPSQT